MPEPEPPGKQRRTSLNTRRHQLAASYDVAVVGGGVNGLAVAREAAMRGLSVVLLERGDIGGQTSSISTRLIHGGLKYLERLDLRLVVESITEQRRLLRDAPHLVRPYPMLIPFYRTNSRPGWLIACGVAVMRVLSLGRMRAQAVGSRGLQRRWPSLDRDGLAWGVLFQDAQVPWTERFCIELALSAEASGAHVLTGAEVTEVTTEAGAVSGVRFVQGGARRSVVARVVVNAAGPWVDSVLGRATPSADTDPLVGPTKGSHVVVDAFPGAPATCVFFEARADSRPMFVLPWGRRYMIGSTDLPYSGSLEAIAADDTEIDYMLSEVNNLIPGARLESSDVLWSYSGVRPLPYVGSVSDPSTISRGHAVVEDAGGVRGLLTVVGGKFTTHRALGEDVVRLALKKCGRRAGRSPTRKLGFPGWPAGMKLSFSALSADLVRDHPWLDARTADRLVSLYGLRCREVVGSTVADEGLAVVVDDESGALAAEVVFALRHEGAQTLEDVLLRRTLIGLNADRGVAAAPAVARIVQDHLGWSDARTAAELGSYLTSTFRFRPGNRPFIADQIPTDPSLASPDPPPHRRAESPQSALEVQRPADREVQHPVKETS